jgi:Uma2 family endonuclease
MSEPAIHRATYADVVAAPEGRTAELIGGELFVSPRPGIRHARAEGEIFGDLRERFALKGAGDGSGWWLLVEPELHLGLPSPEDEVVAPDVAGWRRQRMPRLPDTAAITEPPDWICEVLSPGAAAVRRDRVLKPSLYATRGVGHLWLVDPIAELLEVYRLHGDVYARAQAFAGDARVRAEPFDAIELDLAGWWLPGAPS